MEHIIQFINIFLHLDKYLSEIIQNYGYVTYIILFIIIFCETGLVILPFLPGDSLLFAAGTFAAKGDMSLGVLYVTLCVAAVLGDSVNFEIGNFFGPKIAKQEKTRFFTGLTEKLDEIPPDICKNKILPELIRAFDYASAGSLILAPVLKIGKHLSGDEYQTRIVPSVVKLFRF